MATLDHSQLPATGRISLDRLTPHFPWARFYHNQGYTMSYPEIVFAGEDAYALYTQVTSILMMEAWEKGNYLEYTLSAVSPEDPIHFRLEVALTLDAVHEAWETIRVSAEKLREYYLIATLAYVRKEGLLGKHFTCERTSPTSYKLTLQSEA